MQVQQRGNDFWFHVAALAMVAVWAMSFLSTRVLLDAGLQPTFIFVVRFTIAWFALAAVSRFRLRRVPWRDELLMMLCGVTGGSIYFIAENTALQYTLISDVSILVSMAPMLTALLGACCYRDERVTGAMAVGSVVAFAGVVMLTLSDGAQWGGGIVGDILAIVAALSWAIYSLVLKRLTHTYSNLLVTRKTFFYGVLSALPILVVFPSSCADLSWSTLASLSIVSNLLYLGLICSMAAYYIWAVAVERIGAVRASNYIYLSPLMSMLAAAWWFGERASVVAYMGCVLILVGVMIAMKFPTHSHRH